MNPGERELTLPVGHVDATGRLNRQVAIRKMRGHEESLLYDASLSSGRLITQLIAGCLVRLGDEQAVTPAMVSRLFTGDRSFLLLEIRRFTLGDALPCNYLCPACGANLAVVEDLGHIPVRRYEGDGAPRASTVTLEDGYRDRDGTLHTEIRVRLPRGDDEEFVAETAERDPLRARDALILRCIEAFGTLPRAALEAYGIKILRDLTLGDRRAIYRTLDGDAPGIDLRRSLRCASCSSPFEAFLEPTNFFLLA